MSTSPSHHFVSEGEINGGGKRQCPTTSSLAYKDLRGYLDAVDKLGELRIVDGADWDLEIGAITEVAARAANPKVVLFDNIKDYPKGFRVVTNPVCSAPTTALAFGLDPKLTGLDIIRAWKEKLGSQTPIKPVEVSSGPITENVDSGDKVDLLKFPTPRWHEEDGGRYIGTGCMVIMEDPDGKWTNVGTYRVCVHDKNTLGHLDFAGQAWPADSGKILGAGKTLSGRHQLRSGSDAGQSCELVRSRGACRNWKSPAGCSASR